MDSVPPTSGAGFADVTPDGVTFNDLVSFSLSLSTSSTQERCKTCLGTDRPRVRFQKPGVTVRFNGVIERHRHVPR